MQKYESKVAARMANSDEFLAKYGGGEEVAYAEANTATLDVPDS